MGWIPIHPYHWYKAFCPGLKWLWWHKKQEGNLSTSPNVLQLPLLHSFSSMQVPFQCSLVADEVWTAEEKDLRPLLFYFGFLRNVFNYLCIPPWIPRESGIPQFPRVLWNKKWNFFIPASHLKPWSNTNWTTKQQNRSPERYNTKLKTRGQCYAWLEQDPPSGLNGHPCSTDPFSTSVFLKIKILTGCIGFILFLFFPVYF